MVVKLEENTLATLSLRGVIYLGDRHFVCRFVDSEKQVWFHDGITTKKKCQAVGGLDQWSEKNLRKIGNATAVMAVYTV